MTHQEFLEKLKKDQPNLFSNIEIIGNFSRTDEKILIENEFGKCLVDAMSLLRGYTPTIQTSINKTEYFLKKYKNVHDNIYDHSFIEYKSTREKICIVCNKHGKFNILPFNYINGKGCPKCISENHTQSWSYSDWESIGCNSKSFDSFKLYIIKCNDDTFNESFYKIGKTFKSVNKRFKSKIDLPYKYEIIKIIKGTSYFVSELEQDLKNKYKEYRYIPLKEFGGMYECFKIDKIDV